MKNGELGTQFPGFDAADNALVAWHHLLNSYIYLYELNDSLRHRHIYEGQIFKKNSIRSELGKDQTRGTSIL
jgi:hypothetical protein